MKCHICNNYAVTTLNEKLVCLEHYARLRDISADDAIEELRAAGLLPDQTTDAAFFGE